MRQHSVYFFLRLFGEIYAFATTLSWWAAGDLLTLWQRYKDRGWILLPASGILLLPTVYLLFTASCYEDSWREELLLIVVGALLAVTGIWTGLWLAYG